MYAADKRDEGIKMTDKDINANRGGNKIKFDIHNRWRGDVQFTAEIDCDENTSRAVKIGLAVKWAYKTGADLSSADLSFANLRFADLRSADLRSADLRFTNLRSADLSSANLRFTNLRFADLRFADLRFADLRSADLRSADLRFTNLRFADLRFADLRSADLRFADLSFADLRSADLSSAKYGHGRPMTKAPIQIRGLQPEMGACSGTVLILDAHMKIGCELHSFNEWWAFTDAQISKMGRGALEWWKTNKKVIKAIAKTSGRKV